MEMSDPTLNKLSSNDYVPEKYVKELSQSCVGGPELVRVRNKIQSLSEETNYNLKKNVYENYMQFIDTAKEISHLESEMYQLSHLLTEQKSLLSALSNTSVLGDETPLVTELDINKMDDESDKGMLHQKLAAVMEKVEGCTGLSDVSGRFLLYEGDLLELDPLDNSVLKTVHGYLFTDGLMIANKNSNSRGLMKYKFEIMYELRSLAVVNVRDLGNIKYAFKLLAFPDTRVFQCTSNVSKKEWLDKFDQAKKARLTNEQQQKRDSIVDKSPSRSVSIDSPSLNPFDEPEDETTVHPEWISEVSEELDVCIAQRHFEEALSLLQKAKEYIVQASKGSSNGQPDAVLADIQRKVDQRQTILTDVLMKELEVNPDKSLQGGLRAARRAVRLLNQLGRSTQSCNLFLKLCSSMLKTQCKRVKREGSTNMYIRHLSSVVFTNMCHMTEEFLRAFPNSPNCGSAYVVWASSELTLFTTHFVKQVFVPQTSLFTITECVVLIRAQCERLCTYGIDLCYQLDGALRNPLTKALNDARNKFIDSVKLRSLEDKWIPLNLRSKSGLARFLQEYADIGLKLEGYVTGDCWLQLTANTMAFTKLFLSLLEDCLKLQTTELLCTIDATLYDVYEAHIRYIDQCLRNETQVEQKQFIIKNVEFLLIILLNLIQNKYSTVNGFECSTLVKLKNEYSALVKGVTPSTRNITKYTSNEYI